MKKVLKLNKPVSITPLELIRKFQKDNPEYQSVKLAYAGRLDPMAEGLLLVLVGDECKKRKEYENLPKTYEFEILLGVNTDTFDLMGKILKINFKLNNISKGRINEITERYKGELMQEYPPYSSFRVKGKPLFWWAREKRLDEIKIPSKIVNIYKFKLIDMTEIKSKTLLKIVNEKIKKVKGEFRQKEILQIWEKKLKNKDFKFPISKFKINCSSGTYVRSIANLIGVELGAGAIALSIRRTQIGKFKV